MLITNAGIPQLSVLHHDRARRLITLIDEVYDAGVRLYWTAASDPQSLFVDVSNEILQTEVEQGVLSNEHVWDTQMPPAPSRYSHRAAEMQKTQCEIISFPSL